MNYYNENDKNAAAWLRALIAEKLIPEGKVDERSITEVEAGDLDGFCQCHFFAGIGGWSYALQLAGWPESEDVWTGSCPCQPFSSAGKAQGLCDERHLWPAFRGLVQKRHPSVVFGEQVAGKDGRAWLAGVRSDMEGDGYAVGAADLCAAGVGAPHIRQWLYWVANRPGIKAWRSQSQNGVHRFGETWPDEVSQVGRCCSRHSRKKWRTPRGIMLLANGVSKDVDFVAGFGNAIVPQVAAEFIQAYCEAVTQP